MNAYNPPLRAPTHEAADELDRHPYSRTCNCDACFNAWLAMPEPTPAEREAMARNFSALLNPGGRGVLLTDFPVTFPDLDAADAADAAERDLAKLSAGHRRFCREIDRMASKRRGTA